MTKAGFRYFIRNAVSGTFAVPEVVTVIDGEELIVGAQPEWTTLQPPDECVIHDCHT